MAHSNSRRSALQVLLVLAIVLFPSAALAAGGPPPAQGVHITPIGSPTWRPVDFHLFSAPIGVAPDYAGFGETAFGILPEPNHTYHPDLFVGPGQPHDPPYDQEMADGVAAQGFREGVRFSQAEFSNGMAVYTVWMTVPFPGTTGSSPDFAAGPIIPNSLFPIHVEGISTHNGKMFDPWLTAFDVPALDENLDPPFDVDGHSHVPIFIADNADFGPGGNLRGSYTYQLTMLDATGNGWLVEAHFAIAP